MTNPLEKNSTISPADMQARYQRAQSLMQGMFTKSIAFNTTLVPRWIDDSECFWYEREHQIGSEFRLVNAVEKTNKQAFDHQTVANALAKVSGQTVDQHDLPISKVEMDLSPLQLRFNAFGKRWVFSGDESHCIEIESQPDEWLVSPDGLHAAFLRDHNIWLRDLSNGEERALTQDGEAFYSYASPPSAWGSKHSARVDAQWSPDSKQLLTLQVDTRSVKTLPMIQHVPQNGSLRPLVMGSDRRVAFPGDDHIDEYRFLSIDIASARQQEADYRRCPVFRNAIGFFIHNHGWWAEDSRHAYFIDLERGGDHVARLVEFDCHTGATRIVIEEQSPDACFKLRLDSRMPIHVKPLPNSNDVLWYSERSGWGHLYLYDLTTGKLKHPVTQGDWIVREIHHYDAERRELLIQTAGRTEGAHAYYRDICRVHVDTGVLTPIVSTDHEYIIFDQFNELSGNFKITRDVWGGAGVSPSGAYVVTTRSRADEIPVSLLLDRDGNECLTLETADVSALPEGWQWPEPVKLLAEDGQTDIYGVVYRPSNFSPDQSYPLLDFSFANKEGCGIPAGSFTNNAVAGASYFWPAAMAELGFIVVDIYARGTACRDRAFYTADLDPKLPRSKNQADRVAAIRQLAERYPYIDLDRVGAGGLVSTSAPVSGLLGYPDFYKVGVTNGASIDIGLSPAFYGESYGDLPNTLGERQPTESYVKNLKGKLLLMHGMLHAVVPVAQTFRLIEALQRANKDFDMLLLPNDGYGMSSYAIRRSWDYLVTHLMGAEPPAEFELRSTIDLIRERKAKQAAAAAN